MSDQIVITDSQLKKFSEQEYKQDLARQFCLELIRTKAYLDLGEGDCEEGLRKVPERAWVMVEEFFIQKGFD